MRRPITCFDLKNVAEILVVNGVVNKSLEIAQYSMERNCTSSGSNEILAKLLMLCLKGSL